MTRKTNLHTNLNSKLLQCGFFKIVETIATILMYFDSESVFPLLGEVEASLGG